MNITWYGTASIMIDDGQTKLLFDPFIRMNKKTLNTSAKGFSGADAILITHGHFDHLYSVPEITKVDQKVKVYCTKTPAETLKKNNVKEDRISVIDHGDNIKIGNFTIKPIKSKHIVFDPLYILSVTPKVALHLQSGVKLAKYNRSMPMNGEIMMYEIENEGKRILLTGSFGYFPDVEYPENPDLFILANGGSVLVPEVTSKFLSHVKPKKIMVDHFDDAFPPLTRPVSVARLERKVKNNLPQTEFIVPREYVPVAV